jgi:hypothetical protein
MEPGRSCSHLGRSTFRKPPLYLREIATHQEQAMNHMPYEDTGLSTDPQEEELERSTTPKEPSRTPHSAEGPEKERKTPGSAEDEDPDRPPRSPRR